MLRVMIAAMLAAVGCGSRDAIVVGNDGSSVGSSPDDAAAPADHRTVISEYESQACSTDPADDPLLVCATAYDLACISTYGIQITNPAERARWDGGVRPVFVCRLRCQRSGPACPQIGDVCCSGALPAGGTGTACVPRAMCDALRDAGAD
jgi:hypothetical protein